MLVSDQPMVPEGVKTGFGSETIGACEQPSALRIKVELEAESL